ncbi:type VII secretion protein EccB [Kineosporia sp. J2-2]|uniref:Type VII secretion protein EccB n=1 Tax=Kineosporia corallincola TaxID=2835133 RepID=A0ABS5TAR4_9ACTN|nr:type VII secretion protein EccB [Kineosporia corallincola]MBT0768126.1 type VII secretion protein EccB [Kineosporia corallincola]
MASRRDLLDSYQFAARRVVSATVAHETDPAEWPYRRLGGAGFAALMVTVIALAATGIFGMISPGGKTSWKDGRSVIVVKETGATYVYMTDTGRLHPTPNFASAALLANTTTVTKTSTKSLADVPRGPELGIADAPANLPTPSDLVAPPWSQCTKQAANLSGDQVSRTWMVVGKQPEAGTAVSEEALVVSDTADGSISLIWHDMRFPIKDVKRVGLALGLDNQITVPVGDAWLQALPSGQWIAPIVVDGSGRASTALDGAEVGQVQQVGDGDGAEYFLTLASRLTPITELQAKIQVAAGAEQKMVAAADVADAPQERPVVTSTSPPSQVPAFARLRQADTVICASWNDGGFTPKIFVNSEIPVNSGLDTRAVSGTGTALADRVWVQPGKATLVQSLPSPESDSGPLYLVTDQGTRYAIPSDTALSALGLGSADTWSLPASLVARIPEGPALDPDAARAALQVEEEINDIVPGT